MPRPQHLLWLLKSYFWNNNSTRSLSYMPSAFICRENQTLVFSWLRFTKQYFQLQDNNWIVLETVDFLRSRKKIYVLVWYNISRYALDKCQFWANGFVNLSTVSNPWSLNLRDMFCHPHRWASGVTIDIDMHIYIYIYIFIKIHIGKHNACECYSWLYSAKFHYRLKSD